MASMTMTPSFAISKQLPPTAVAAGRRGSLVVRAAKVSEGEKMEAKSGANGRRDLVFAAAAAAACTLAKVGMADEVEPKPGTTEAKKKYAPVCITMPTARICRR